MPGLPFGCWNRGSGISTMISGRTARRHCASIWQGRSGQRIGIACQAEQRRGGAGKGQRGRGHGSLSWLWIVALPLPGQSHPPVTRTAFKRWAGGRQRCRPFKDGGQLISAARDEPRLCIAKHMWTPPSSSLSSKRVDSGWVLAYVRPRSAAGWPRALMISADHGPYQIIALLGAVSRTGFPDPRQNR